VPHSLKDHSKRQFNLLAIFGDDLVDSRTRKGLLLTAPVDTCIPGNASEWTDLGGNPFKPFNVPPLLSNPIDPRNLLDFD